MTVDEPDPGEATPGAMSLAELGWNPFFETHFEAFRKEGLVPARIAREERDLFGVYSEIGRLAAEVTGRMRHEARSRTELPAVGDWVAIAPRAGEGAATIHAVLPRRSRLSRKQSGATTEEQILAANIDVAFLVSGLDGGRNFHLPTIERYLTLARASGATPVILLNKSDLCAEAAARAVSVEPIAHGVPVHAVSALLGHGLDDVRRHLEVGKTAVFLGRSGVGKSALINGLLGSELLPVGAVRESDRRGRHTTTWREMILLPGAGVVIDTPGIRELEFWGGEQEGVVAQFTDIEKMALGCRFSDCHHRSEPGCAVLAAVAAGTLDAERLESYHSVQSEIAGMTHRRREKAYLAGKAKKKQLQNRHKRRAQSRPDDE